MAVILYIEFCLSVNFLRDMIGRYSCRLCGSICVYYCYRKTRYLISQQFFSFSRICVTRDFDSEPGLWNCMAWFFSMDYLDSCIQIPFRLLHPLPSRHSRTHLKIINIHICQKLAAVVGVWWYVTWEEFVFQCRKISEFPITYNLVSLHVEAYNVINLSECYSSFPLWMQICLRTHTTTIVTYTMYM